MTSMKSRTWPLAEATEVAEELITLLRPNCERIEVAGSVRRQKARVGDVELLAVSKTSPSYLNVRPDRPRLEYVHLDARVLELITKDILRYRLNKKGSRTYGRLNKLLVHVPSGIGVDLFSTTTENWGMSLVVRTGSASFCIQVMSRLKALGHSGHAYGGITLKSGEEIDCPTEEEVFRILGWAWMDPQQRE